MTGPVTDAELAAWSRATDPRDGTVRITAEQLARVKARVDAQRAAGDALDAVLHQMCKAHQLDPRTAELIGQSLAMIARWRVAR